MDVLVIYQFCTFGGVERLILNRATAFKKHGVDVVIHVGYLSDGGALNSFNNYLKKNNLENRVIPFIISGNTKFNNAKYDLTLVINSPQILDRLSSFNNVFVECHTPYVENRRYLGNISSEITGIIVPSLAFKTIVQDEYPNLISPIVLPNPLPDEFHEVVESPSNLMKSPLVYLARLDNLKNFEEAVQIFKLLKDRKDLMFIVIGEGGADKKIIASFEHLGLIENSILRDRIDFFQVPRLISMVKKAKGIFLSPSKGESFGLSAAEFISGGVPVLLSNIPAHNALVDNDEHFFYDLGDKKSAKSKIEYLLKNWGIMSNTVSEYGQKFKDDLFIEAWVNFLKYQGI